MHNERTQGRIYHRCLNDGSYIDLAKSDSEVIISMLQIAESDLDSAKKLVKINSPTDNGWNAIYKLSYDVLHAFTEAFLIFDKIKARTHECLFAYLCEKHPELEFNWNFFEKVRTKRNQTQYYGEIITYSDWKDAELQFHLYISTLKKAIEQKLSEKQ